MIPGIVDFARAAGADFGVRPRRALEVGSRDVNGSIRAAFPGVPEYVGVDLEAGPGVDVVMDGRDVGRLGVFDLALCCECLEHDPRPWEVLAAVRGVVRPGGWLLVSVPTFGFPYHGYPRDYYRFSEDWVREVAFAGWEVLRVGTAADAAGHSSLVGLGRSPDSGGGG